MTPLRISLKEGDGKIVEYKLVPVMDNDSVDEAPSKTQITVSKRAMDEPDVRVLIDGKERTPMKILLRKSDAFGRFSLGKGDESVINKKLLVIVLEPVDPDDRMFMEPFTIKA